MESFVRIENAFHMAFFQSIFFADILSDGILHAMLSPLFVFLPDHGVPGLDERHEHVEAHVFPLYSVALEHRGARGL